VAAPKLGDVKRYGVEKEEKLDDAGVRVTADELKVYNEADTTTPEVATLPKNLLVFRLVKMESFSLVEFPSGIGQFSQGWVETEGLSEQAEKVTREGALTEQKVATVKAVSTTTSTPKPSAAAAASTPEKNDPKETPKEVASAAPKPTATASEAPETTATPRTTASTRLLRAKPIAK
jgi:hypothetical protein